MLFRREKSRGYTVNGSVVSGRNTVTTRTAGATRVAATDFPDAMKTRLYGALMILTHALPLCDQVTPTVALTVRL